MKHKNFRVTMRLLILALVSLTLFTPPLTAQIGNLGIYGGAPTPASTPWTCGTPVYAQLTNYPDYMPQAKVFPVGVTLFL